MGQKTVTVFTDDLTNEECVEAGTHTFSLNGITYEIDLSPESYDRLLEDFSPYLKAARKVGKSKDAAKSPRSSGPSASLIREWAQSNGLEVNARGRVPAHVREAYAAAR